jgi:hypothetical protein
MSPVLIGLVKVTTHYFFKIVQRRRHPLPPQIIQILNSHKSPLLLSDIETEREEGQVPVPGDEHCGPPSHAARSDGSSGRQEEVRHQRPRRLLRVHRQKGGKDDEEKEMYLWLEMCAGPNTIQAKCQFVLFLCITWKFSLNCFTAMCTKK